MFNLWSMDKHKIKCTDKKIKKIIIFYTLYKLLPWIH